MDLREWVTVVPARGELGNVARALLDLADDPKHVRTAGGGTEFLVHPLVAEKYNTPPKPRRGRRSKAESEASE